MLRSEVIRKRLNKLDEYLDILRHLRRYSFEEFMGDPERYGSVERFLQLAIEVVNDVGNHIIADLELGTVNWYSDIPAILKEKGYITESQANKWNRMIGFRNTLVPDYLEVDREIVYHVL